MLFYLFFIFCKIYHPFFFFNFHSGKLFHKTLNENDLYELPNFVRASNALKVFHNNRKKSLIGSLFYTLRKDLFVQFCYSIVWSIVNTLAPPYFLRKILLYIQNYPNN